MRPVLSAVQQWCAAGLYEEDRNPYQPWWPLPAVVDTRVCNGRTRCSPLYLVLLYYQCSMGRFVVRHTLCSER